MAASRWDPKRPPTADAVRDLADHLRFLLDREGLTPRELADDHDIPYSTAMLYRFLSGQALPPPLLIEVVTRRCGGDTVGLELVYDRALRAALAGSFRRPARHARPGRSGPAAGPRLAAVGLGLTVVVAVGGAVLASTSAPGGTDQRRAAAGEPGRPPPPVATAPPGEPPPLTNPPADPEAKVPVPPPSDRRRPQKRRPPPQFGPELVRNGTFTGGLDPWEVDGVEAEEDDGRLTVDIFGDEDDDDLQSADVDSNEFALRAGQRYVLNFDAAADSDVEIGVSINPADDDVVLFREMDLDTPSRHFRFEVTPGNDAPESIVSFEFGGHSNEHTVLIDNVSLRSVTG